MQEKKTSLFVHLQELRRVLIISLAAVFTGMAVSYTFFRGILMLVVFGPLERLGKELVIIGVTEGFMVQLKLAFIGGIILSCPVVFWQVLGFVLPALYKYERKIFWLSFFSSIILFTAGIAFGYLCVLGLGLEILLFDFAAGITVMISAGKYLSFFISFLLPFGLIFQIPLVTFLLTRMGLISPQMLRKKRGYVALFIFVLAALLSPGGDILSQVLLAIPMLFLYESSILLAVIVKWRQSARKL